MQSSCGSEALDTSGSTEGRTQLFQTKGFGSTCGCVAALFWLNYKRAQLRLPHAHPAGTADRTNLAIDQKATLLVVV